MKKALNTSKFFHNFEKTVDSLFINKDVDLYITGSNAYLLSSELATLLTGRYIEIKMLPLSFKEYMSSFEDKTDLSRKFRDYLRYSSFPQAVELYKVNPENINMFLDGTYNTVLFKDVMQRTYPEEILKHYFDMNNKEFGYDEDNNVIIHDEEETEFDYKRKEAYLESINLTKLLEYSKNKLFLNRLLKQCNNKRYFRHLDDFNYYIGRHVNKSMGTSNNKTNTADALPDLIEKIVFDRFTFDIYKLNEGNNYAISRAIVYFIADILKTTPLRDPSIYSIYFYNMNCVALSEIDKYDHLTGAAKRFYDNLVEFISNIYLYFKFQKK